ncbi:hypothetical protein WJX75_005894 [Coccomyxa subellipsoidea]|uniref:Uncharacterized protein n=1 Tax=Coccomyxa subellipsoidea TaxID=248742 RepID=A0ABR2Z3Y0_9CHLO
MMAPAFVADPISLTAVAHPSPAIEGSQVGIVGYAVNRPGGAAPTGTVTLEVMGVSSGPFELVMGKGRASGFNSTITMPNYFDDEDSKNKDSKGSLARLLKQASNIGEMTVALLGEGALNDHLRYTMAALAVRTLSSSRKS